MSHRIVTYRSENADPSKEWLAQIETPTGTMLIFAHAATEKAAIEKMTAWVEQQRAVGRTPRAPLKRARAA